MHLLLVRSSFLANCWKSQSVLCRSGFAFVIYCINGIIEYVVYAVYPLLFSITHLIRSSCCMYQFVLPFCCSVVFHYMSVPELVRRKKVKSPRSLFTLLCALQNVSCFMWCPRWGFSFLLPSTLCLKVSLCFARKTLELKGRALFFSLWWEDSLPAQRPTKKPRLPGTASCVTSLTIPPATITQECGKLILLSTSQTRKARGRVLWNSWVLVLLSVPRHPQVAPGRAVENWSQLFLIFLRKGNVEYFYALKNPMRITCLENQVFLIPWTPIALMQKVGGDSV